MSFPLPQALTLIPAALSFFQKWLGQQTVLESLKPGARIGTYDPGAGETPIIDTNNIPDYLANADPWVASTIDELGQTDARAGAYNAQLQENARAREAARPYLQSIHDRGTTGRMQQLPGEVNALNKELQEVYREVRENPDIWTTQEMSALASRYADQMAPALRGELADIDATAARLGLSPAAVESMRTIARTGASQNQAAYEQAMFIANALESDKRKQWATDMAGQIGGYLSGLEGTLQSSADAAANAADLLMATFEGTPENYLLLGDLAYESDTADTLMEAGAYDAAAEYLMSLADMGSGLWRGKMQKQAAAAASKPGSFSSLGGPIGAGLSLALTPLFPGAPLWATIGDAMIGYGVGQYVGNQIE